MQRIAVIGQGEIPENAAGAELARLAEECGRRIAESGALLVCGGLGGVMRFASKGANEAGGQVLGILPGSDVGAANRYVTVPVATGMGEARNLCIVNTAQGFLAIGGAYGTLSEIAFALRKQKPVVGLRCSYEIEGMLRADSPELALTRLLGSGDAAG